MKWRKVTLPFTRLDAVDLFVGGRGGIVNTFVVVPSARGRSRCHCANRLRGRVADIRMDQRGTEVPWKFAELPACCRSPELDLRRGHVFPGHEQTLDELKYDIANAMNAAFSDRGFSRHFKKLVVGSWSSEDGTMTFSKDGRYRLSGRDLGPLATAPRSGKWFCGRNMLWLMDAAVNGGIRTQVVGITDDTLTFPGGAGVLQHVYQRTKNAAAKAGV